MRCTNCDSEDDYVNIGNHWRQSCEYPTPSDREELILDGLMMGDGTVSRRSDVGNPSVDIIGTNWRFLSWLQRKLDPLFVTLEVDKTPEEAARGDSPVEMKELPRQVYRLRSRRLPWFSRYESWYSEEGKEFPEDIQLSPEVVRYWYVCDGGLSWNKQSRSSRAQICSANEKGRLEEFARYFGDIGVKPSVYEYRLMFNREGTEWFLDWIGGSLPGFEYKWEDKNLEEYENQYQEAYA